MSARSGPDLIGLIEAYYVVSILDFLHNRRILQGLAAGQDIGAIAHAAGFDPTLLEALVSFVRQRAGFALPKSIAGAGGADAVIAAHLLDQYIGGFGPCLARLDGILSGSCDGAEQVDFERHAHAFADADRGTVNRIPTGILDALDVTDVIDLGCGTGGLLMDFVAGRESRRGWGIDVNPFAVEIAQRRSAKEKLQERISFVIGDSFNLGSALPSRAIADAQIILAFNVANAFFGNDKKRNFESWLRGLRTVFPNRFLLLGDYYGRLGHTKTKSDRFRRTLIHDIAQLLSGQGVPPPDLPAWWAALDACGCTLVKSYEREDQEVAHFIYFIQL